MLMTMLLKQGLCNLKLRDVFLLKGMMVHVKESLYNV